MVKIDNSNYNKVSVKTDSAVKLIETLKDLGVFKEKRKSAPRRKKTSLSSEDIRQDNDMGAGFTQPTQVRVEADTQGLTEEDVKTQTDALVAKIRDEVAQNRLEDLQKSTQNLFTLFTAVQPRIQRTEESFRQPFDPFRQSTTVIQLPDVEEREFSGTLNEGAPEEESEKQQNIFTGQGNEPPALTGGGSSKPKKIYLKKDKKAKFIDNYNLEPFPLAGQFGVNKMYNYYKKFLNATGEEEDISITGDASQMRQAMTDIINSTELI
jgi:hypothetical protein